jgi:hypothetical protein
MSAASEPIICRTTPWYHKRRLLMIAMLLGMGGWFLYDWAFKYPADKARYDEYYPVYTKMMADKKETEWFELARAKKWPEKVDTKDWDWKIKEQLVYGIVTCAIGLGVAGVYLKNKNHELRSDATSVTPAGGPAIPFSSIFRIDMRKWKSKGLAYLSYRNDAGAEKTSVIDCLIFDEQNAEAVMARVMENFKGELVELDAPPAESTTPDDSAKESPTA